ncbi:MAG TPA: phage tail protein [Dehalococcoidia bacterium]|nr:phage tail protein [Dehalococcoidia bacterium]
MANTFAGDSLKSDKYVIGPRYCVEIDGLIEATFSECSGLSATLRTDKWEEGGANETTLKFPGRTDFGNIVLKRGVTSSAELFRWFTDQLMGVKNRKTVTIKLVNHDLEVLESWEFKDAFPVKWTGPTLQATSNAIAIESFEIAHDGFLKLPP